MAKTKLERISSIEEEIRQLENQRKQLLQQHKEQERKERTHRLCRRGGLLESMVPATIDLSDEQFKTLLEKTISSEYGRKILVSLSAQGADVITSVTAETIPSDDAGNGGDTINLKRATG